MPSPKFQGLAHTAYDADGVTTTWNFNFTGGYLDPSHVKAYTVTAGLTTFLGTVPLAGPAQALLVPALPVGTEVHIYRDTPKDLPIVDFTDGSSLTEIALDTNAKQAVFIAAEASDYAGIGSTTIALEAAATAVEAASVLVAATVWRLNPQVITESVTMPANYNGVSAGPLTISSEATVTVPTGNTWIVI